MSVGLGLKGMIVLELTASGAAWGHGPEDDDPQRMAAALVGSPPFRLAQALAMPDRRDGRGCAVTDSSELWHYRKPLEA